MTGSAAFGPPSVLVVGYSAFDVIVPVKDFPVPDEKCEVSRVITGGGGPGATAAVAMARLGAKVKFMSPLTDDVSGRVQRKELLAAGVDLSLCPILENVDSPRAVILVEEDRPRRTIFWARGDVPHLPAASAGPELLDGMDLLYIDGHEPEVSLRLAGVARERGLPVVMDAGSVRSGSRELVGVCSDVIGSRGFAPALTGCPRPLDALRALRDLGPARVGMTFGESGVLGLEGERLFPVPAFDVPVRDTTGAGDAFHAGYAFALTQHLSFEECLEWGCAVAGFKCRDWGGRRGLPTRDQVEDLMASGRRRGLGDIADQLPSTED